MRLLEDFIENFKVPFYFHTMLCASKICMQNARNKGGWVFFDFPHFISHFYSQQQIVFHDYPLLLKKINAEFDFSLNKKTRFMHARL